MKYLKEKTQPPDQVQFQILEPKLISTPSLSGIKGQAIYN